MYAGVGPRPTNARGTQIAWSMCPEPQNPAPGAWLSPLRVNVGLTPGSEPNDFPFAEPSTITNLLRRKLLKEYPGADILQPLHHLADILVRPCTTENVYVVACDLTGDYLPPQPLFNTSNCNIASMPCFLESSKTRA